MGFQTHVHSTCLHLCFADFHSLQPQLDCGAEEIKVKVDKCLLGGLGLEEEVIAYLRDPNCSSILQTGETNWVSVTSPVQASACRNILEVSGFHTTAARRYVLG